MAYLKVAQISEMRANRYARNARTYDDPLGRGKRLNLFAIVYRFRVNRTTFERRQRRGGWPSLGGRALEALVMGAEETFLESEVNEALKPFRPTGRFVLAGVEYYSFERTMRELGATWQVLNSWARDFPFWEKGTLVFQWFNSPETCVPVRACRVANVNLAKEKLREAKTGRITLPDGKTYLSPKQRDRTWQIDGRSPPVQTIYWWRSKGCRHLDGRKNPAACRGEQPLKKLETKSLPNLSRRRGQICEAWTLEEHVLCIRAALLQEKDRQEQPVKKAARRKRPVELFDGVFNEQPERRITIPRAKKEGLLKGVVSYTQLYSYLVALPAGFGLEKYFPEGRFPSQVRVIPGSTEQVSTVLPSDLKKLGQAKRELLYQAGLRRAGKTGSEICDDYGIQDIADRFAMHAFLAGTFKSEQNLRATGGARG